jgi:hypothetical protein
LIEALDWIDDVLMLAGIAIVLLSFDNLFLGGGIFLVGAALHAIMHGMI